MSKFDRFCRKYNHLGIRNLITLVLAGNIIVLAVMYGRFDWYQSIAFIPSKIWNGEWWRIFTLMFDPGSQDLIFLIFYFMFTYWIGSTLEREWGRLKFTIFYFSGVLFTVLYGLLAAWLASGSPVGVNITLNCYYVHMSLLLAFATLYPDMQIRLFMVIPIKIKWLAIVDAAIMVVPMLFPPYYLLKFVPLVALGNYALFFSGDLFRYALRRGKARARAVPFQRAVRDAKKARGYIHKCAVCGITDADNPQMEFRYCSLCSGYQCYCSEHIFGHEHI